MFTRLPSRGDESRRRATRSVTSTTPITGSGRAASEAAADVSGQRSRGLQRPSGLRATRSSTPSRRSESKRTRPTSNGKRSIRAEAWRARSPEASKSVWASRSQASTVMPKPSDSCARPTSTGVRRPRERLTSS